MKKEQNLETCFDKLFLIGKLTFSFKSLSS